MERLPTKEKLCYRGVCQQQTENLLRDKDDSTNENKHNDILGPFLFYYIHNKSMTHIMTYKHIHANLGNES